jgi:hypothetical protein
MSKLFNALFGWFERVGKARAAAELHRAGYAEEAKRLMLEVD